MNAHVYSKFVFLRVYLGSVYSDIHRQEMDSPQGSILSVTLFILKINSIADVIPSTFEKFLFVDDFSIGCSSRIWLQ